MKTAVQIVSAILAAVSLLFVGCAQSQTPVMGTAVVQTQAVEKVVVESKVVEKPITSPSAKWDGAYDKVPPELCPPEKVCEGRLTFGDEIEPYEGGDVKEAWVRHGLFANAQGELFRMDVIGANPDAIKLYTEEVRVCLDQVFTGEVSAGMPAEPASYPLPEGLLGGTGDLIIEVYLLERLDPAKVSDRDLASELARLPVREWADMLKQMGVTAEQGKPGEVAHYMVDVVVDPRLEKGSTHHYPQRSAAKAYVDVSVALGGGSVSADFLKNATRLDSRSVTKGIDPESASMSDDNQGTAATYDLAVGGNDSSLYRLSGRFEWGGWSATYESPQPCPPGELRLELTPGQSSTCTLEVMPPATPIPKLNVLLLFDVSSSMGEEIQQVKENATIIMDAVKSKVDGAAFGVASFSDYPYTYDYAGAAHGYGIPGDESGTPGDYPWSLDLNMTRYTDDVKKTLDALVLRNGGDDPECYSRALYEAISEPSWEAETKKVVVLFGDAMAHDSGFLGIDNGVDPGRNEKPGDEDDLVFAKVVEQLKEQGIEVIPINCAPVTDTNVAAVFDYLAKETAERQAYNLAAATEVPGAVLSGLEAATSLIKELVVWPDPAFGDWVRTAPEVQKDVVGEEKRPFDVTITVPQGMSSGTYEFNLTFLGDGAKLDSYHVVLDVRP